MFGGRADSEAETAKAEATAAAEAAKTASDEAARKGLEYKLLASDIRAAILSFVPMEALAVDFDGEVATVTGRAKTQSDKEKAILIAGNTEGVARVEDKVTVSVQEPPAVYHTVARGDTLSAIADRYYGVMRLYDAIFAANQPMLKHPDEIYPGQVLRIPPAQPPTHTVQGGETLGTIAKHWYGDSQKYTLIAQANGIDPDKISVGQSLKIPLVNPKVS